MLIHGYAVAIADRAWDYAKNDLPQLHQIFAGLACRDGTAGGMNAERLSAPLASPSRNRGRKRWRSGAQLLVSPADRIVVIEPGWPNIGGGFMAAGGTIALGGACARQMGGGTLDFEVLLKLPLSATRAVVLNSPNNPTG